jgi:hypothetical protein
MLPPAHLAGDFLLHAVLLLPLISGHSDRGDIVVSAVLHTEEPALALNDLLLALADLLLLLALFAPSTVPLLQYGQALLDSLSAC